MSLFWREMPWIHKVQVHQKWIYDHVSYKSPPEQGEKYDEWTRESIIHEEGFVLSRIVNRHREIMRQKTCSVVPRVDFASCTPHLVLTVHRVSNKPQSNRHKSADTQTSQTCRHIPDFIWLQWHSHDLSSHSGNPFRYMEGELVLWPTGIYEWLSDDNWAYLWLFPCLRS